MAGRLQTFFINYLKKPVVNFWEKVYHSRGAVPEVSAPSPSTDLAPASLLVTQNVLSIPKIERTFSSVFTRTTGKSWNVLTRNANDGGANSVLSSLILSKTSQQLENANITVQRMLDSSINLTKVISDLEVIALDINGLSDQSKIVSLNAFIEATHAGDHEKDFAVVAKELGELSENIKKISINMHKLLRSINDQVKSNREICSRVAGTFEVVESDLTEFNFLMDKVQDLSSSQTRSFTTFEKDMDRHFKIPEAKRHQTLKSIS